jgi:hypothetical protein
MDQANDSKVTMVDEKGGLLSRRRVLQSAAVATVGLAIGRAGTPRVAWADGGGGIEDDESTILRFSTMAGIQKPFLGAASVSAFRGLQGGGAPWVVSRATGSLTSEGHLVVRVRGLVLDPAAVPAPAGGTNPLPSFMAIVSGFSTDPAQPVNLLPPLFPASPAGDADIEARLILPHPFFAPVVFVTSLPLGTPPAPRWLAVTGQK